MGTGNEDMVDVVVVGAGLAGLACAGDLASEGRRVVLLEASQEVGGRVRTDEVDAFLLDRGFQVVLEAYPRIRSRVDLEALDLRPFYRGALVRYGGEFHRVADPASSFLDALRSVASPVGSMSDKLQLATLRKEILAPDPDELLEAPAPSTGTLLREAGFSESIIDRFFRPFFGGVLLDPELKVSGRLFRYYFRMFVDGACSIPARGMGTLPRQLAAALPEGVLRTGHRVRALHPRGVELEDGGIVEARVVVVAVEGPEAARLLGGEVADPGSRGVTCLYFDASRSPVNEAVLVLNGEGPSDGPVNNLAVLSDAAPGYAPEGRALVSVTVLDPAEGDPETLKDQVLQQLSGWYGEEVGDWRFLRRYRIEHAQPLQTPEAMDPVRRPVRLGDRLFVCGDHRDQASLDGALASGERAAAEVLQVLRNTRP